MDIGGILSGIVGGLFGLGGQSMNNEAQKELAEYNWQQQIKQWERQNEYNLPINQIQRLKDANLNPNLMYQGNVQNIATSMPSRQMPNTNYDFSSALQLAMMAQQQSNSNLLAKKQAEKYDADIHKANSDANLADTRANKLMQEKDYFDDTKDLQKAILEGKVKITSTNAQYLQDQIEMGLAEQAVKIENIKSSTDLNNSNIDLNQLKGVLVNAQAIYYSTNSQYLKVKMKTLIDETAALIKLQEAQTKSLEFDVTQYKPHLIGFHNAQQSLARDKFIFGQEAFYTKLGWDQEKFRKTLLLNGVKFGADTYFKYMNMSTSLLKTLMPLLK